MFVCLVLHFGLDLHFYGFRTLLLVSQVMLCRRVDQALRSREKEKQTWPHIVFKGQKSSFFFNPRYFVWVFLLALKK
jgi:hypothetical protein